MYSNSDGEPVQNMTVCVECRGRGKKSKGLSNKAKARYKAAVEEFECSGGHGQEPIRPSSHLVTCKVCKGTGVVRSDSRTVAEDGKYPHVAIIGAGIGGMALAVACLHRGIPFTLFERDLNFEARSQGYGLTLQQARKAMDGFGVFDMKGAVMSTRHLVHTTEGEVIGEWGVRKYLNAATDMHSKRNNIHIARQALRLELLAQLGGQEFVRWNHKLVDIKKSCGAEQVMQLSFLVDGKPFQTHADLVVGADGIRSTVRRLLLGERTLPLRYLGCIVILGICPMNALIGVESPLLDGATVFQTANGNERIYMMPYTKDALMWQLSFPMREDDAKALSVSGAAALKKEACRRTLWHSPIPEILAATDENQISGYPVYDRGLLSPVLLNGLGAATLIGDAAHPMSPFKGQGANQALLDALTLARTIYKNYQFVPLGRVSVRDQVLIGFESLMLERSAIKVKESADAAVFLHSDVVLRESDQPRGSCFKQIHRLP